MKQGEAAMGFTLYHTGMLPGLPDKVVFDVDGVTVGDFFRMLSDAHGDQVLRGILDQEGNIAEGILVAINGKLQKPRQVASAAIPPECTVLISTLTAGG
jgi:hypothetical protein